MHYDAHYEWYQLVAEQQEDADEGWVITLTISENLNKYCSITKLCFGCKTL